MMFERWLHATFPSVHFMNADTTFEESFFKADGTRIARKATKYELESFKWKCGAIEFNAIRGGSKLAHYDFVPAATHSEPPFNVVKQSFAVDKPYQLYTIAACFPAVDGDAMLSAFHTTAEENQIIRERAAVRLENHQRRFPTNLEVIADDDGSHTMWYTPRTCMNILACRDVLLGGRASTIKHAYVS